MSKECCPTDQNAVTNDANYRRTLWIVLLLNGAMFIAEIIAGLVSGSVSLQADALDFLGDAANYGIALYVLARSVRIRAYSALVKSTTMFEFGLWVISQVFYKIYTGTPPEAEVMGAVGFSAFAVNMYCFYLLSRHSREDSNRKSVWLCSRNDAICNIAVILAAGAVHYTNSYWPDLIVAAIISGLAISGAWQVTIQARKELRA